VSLEESASLDVGVTMTETASVELLSVEADVSCVVVDEAVVKLVVTAEREELSAVLLGVVVVEGWELDS
jgi:hypothetical protein